MKIPKTIDWKILLTVFVAATALLVIRMVFVFKLGYIFLFWNLFLAFVPIIFAYLVIKTKPIWIKWVMGLLWLFFFPNSPYMITDYIYINLHKFLNYKGTGKYFDHYDFSDSLVAWGDLVMLTLFIGLGVLFGLISLFYMQKVFIKYFGKHFSWTLVAGVSILSGFAIYIGRFLRFNSWDLFTRPFHTIGGMIQTLNLESLLFTLLFGVFLFIIYLPFYSLAKSKNA